MNFISTFEELNKLYEEAKDAKQANEKSEDVVEEACDKEALTEAAEDDVIEIEDEAAEVEAAVDEPELYDDTEEELEPKQVIMECDKCGALVLRDEDAVIVDEESGLANVEDECEFCEEASGYKIVGVVAPYEPEEAEAVVEDLADWYRKKFDRPASISTQQNWEDELNDDSISMERRKHLERKFAQQRDWEERHPDKEVK